VDDIFGQRDHAVRFDWGLPGALATDADVCVVVDVLSFSTSVTIAVERGMRVFPFAWKDERAASYAARLAAALAVALAVGRLEATHEAAVPAPSLSPAGLMECEPVPRLVLPSPKRVDDLSSAAGHGCHRAGRVPAQRQRRRSPPGSSPA
jgi:2-phosphosulfolactate phosphatase